MENIRISFSRTSPTSDGTSINYIFSISLGLLSWEIGKRFSEFEFLLEQLETAYYAQLPSLPSKTIPLFGLDSAGILQRAADLVSLLQKMSQRPDIRKSVPFKRFVELKEESPTHELSRGRTQLAERFGVTALTTLADALVVAHADTTSLSRLGKVWSIVESDELGSLSVWTVGRSLIEEKSENSLVSSDVMQKLGEKVYGKILPEKPIAMDICRTTGRIVLGLSNGHIVLRDIRALDSPAIYDTPAHGVSPVVALVIIQNKYIVSVGLDDAVRVCVIDNGEMVAGGKLSKRFESGEHFTCLAAWECQSDKTALFMGTNKGRVFVYELRFADIHYSVKEVSPGIVLSYNQTLSMTSYPVRAISVGNNSGILVGFDGFIFGFERDQISGQFKRSMQISTLHKTAVHSLSALPNTNYLVAGLSDGSVCLYDETTLVYARYFSEEPVTVIHCSESTHGHVLWVGCDDGRVVEVLLPNTLREDAAYAKSSAEGFEIHKKANNPIGVTQVVNSTFPQSLTNTIHLSPPYPLATAMREMSPMKSLAPALINVSSLGTNPKCLDENESGDEEWKRTLFKN